MYRTARTAQLPFLAAAIAYYAFVSLVPLLALALVVSAAVGGEAFVERLLERTEAVLTPETQELLREALVGGTGRAGATIAGALVLAWSALKVMRGLDVAFSTIYDRRGTLSFLGNLRNAVVVIAAIGLGAAGMAAIHVGVGLLPLGLIAEPVAVLLGVLTLTVLFLPMYYVFPGGSVGVGEVLPGAVVAAVGWTLLGTVFSVYVEFAAGVALYGLLGGIVLLLTALYAGAFLLMFGAVTNVTVAADRQLQQAASPDLELTRAMTGGPADEPTTDADDATSAADDGDQPTEFDAGERSPEERRLREEVAELRGELQSFQDDVEERTVERAAVERDLRRYVRRRVRRGHASGWGPYLVLLYGTAMTIGAFYFLSGIWAILAMIVVWLSTLGLFVVMVVVGLGISLLGIPGRIRDRIGDWRS